VCLAQQERKKEERRKMKIHISPAVILGLGYLLMARRRTSAHPRCEMCRFFGVSKEKEKKGET
jgi:hypothetical protein